MIPLWLSFTFLRQALHGKRATIHDKKEGEGERRERAKVSELVRTAFLKEAVVSRSMRINRKLCKKV